MPLALASALNYTHLEAHRSRYQELPLHLLVHGQDQEAGGETVLLQPLQINPLQRHLIKRETCLQWSWGQYELVILLGE